MDSLMQNGLTVNQAKYTKNHGSFFWTNRFTKRRVGNMKPRVFNHKTTALTLVEVLVVIFVLVIVVAMMMPALSASRHKKLSIDCQNRLKEIGQAFNSWQADHNSKFPMQVSVANGGVMELAAAGDVAACFQEISSRLTSPKALICPTEKILRPAMNFSAGFDNSNISYFVGLDANTNIPQAFLSGDDNFTFKGVPVKSGVFNLSTNANQNFEWAQTRHGGMTGNLCFSDGSVQNSYPFRLRWEQLPNTGLATNRFAIP
jgi:prepilin-type processing-associated H-X9-DG protein